MGSKGLSLRERGWVVTEPPVVGSNRGIGIWADDASFCRAEPWSPSNVNATAAAACHKSGLFV